MKDLMNFCNNITPPNWHVTDSRERFVFHGPGSLNIFVRIIDHFIDGWIYAFKKNCMKFYPVSFYTGRHDKAVASLQLYGEHLVAESEIWLYPEGCQFFGDNIYAAAVHELAHVAVDRHFAVKHKSYKILTEKHAIRGGQLHGKAFCRSFKTLIMRINALYGKDHGDILESLDFELNNYRYEMTTSEHESSW